MYWIRNVVTWLSYGLCTFLALRQAGRWIKPRASAGRAVIGIAVGGVSGATDLS